MAEPNGAPRVPPGFRLFRIRVTPGSVALVLGASVLAVLLRNAFVAAHRQIGWAVACVVVASLLAPLADLLDKRMPRWLALLVTMLSLAVMTVVVWGAIIVNVQDGLSTLSNEAPRAAASLERRSEVAKDFRLVERVNSLIATVRRPSQGTAVGQAVGAAGTYFVCGILTLFFLIYGPRMLRSAFAQVRDPGRRTRIERRTGLAMKNGRRYIVAAIAQTVVVSAGIGLASWALSLPAPFVLGALAGTIGLVPTLGVLVGSLPALLLAAGLNGWRDAVIVVGAAVVLQAVEVLVVRKRVDRASVHIGPALPAIVALLGYELYGIGGAMYGAAALAFLIAWLDVPGIDDTPAPDVGDVRT